MSTPAVAQSVPIYHGSTRFREVEVGPFRITDVRFGAGSRLDPHYHDRPNIGVMLGGSFDLSFGSLAFACEPGAVFVEPAGETHCNCMGCRGASVLAVQPDPSHPDLCGTGLAGFTMPFQLRHAQAVHLARRIAREIRTPDDFSGLMVQGLALELLAIIGRAGAPSRSTDRRPWLARIEVRLRDAVPRRVILADLAREAGVHPAHLTREFRVRYGCSLGTFVLERRLEWAARQLAASERPIVEIGLQAGFSDQSHFTRRFREYAGSTPHRFRRHARAATRSMDRDPA